jgi:hypothetical protein
MPNNLKSCGATKSISKFQLCRNELSKFLRSLTLRGVSDYLRINQELLLRLLVMAVLFAAYQAIDWTILQKFLRFCLSMAMMRLGHLTESIDIGPGVILMVDSRWFSIIANCTYIHLFLLLSPFWWQTGKRIGANLFGLGILALLVWSVNFVRLLVTLHTDLHGVPWFIAHGLIDRIINATATLTILSVSFYRDRIPAPGRRVGQDERRAVYS